MVSKKVQLVKLGKANGQPIWAEVKDTTMFAAMMNRFLPTGVAWIGNEIRGHSEDEVNQARDRINRELEMLSTGLPYDLWLSDRPV